MAVKPRGECTMRVMMPEDLPALLDLWVESWQAPTPGSISARGAAGRSPVCGIAARRRTDLVAETEGRLDGMVTVQPSSGYIDQIVVATGSQRRGIASRLISAAREVSPDRLQLHVNQDNTPAVAFYRHEGFVVAGHDVNSSSGAANLPYGVADMTRSELAMGSATFIAIMAAGFLSQRYLDRHFVAPKAPAPSTSSAACVDENGSWKNWPWPNVPALSPKCRPDR